MKRVLVRTVTTGGELVDAVEGLWDRFQDAITAVCPEGICDGSGEVLNFESDEYGTYIAGTRRCPAEHE